MQLRSFSLLAAFCCAAIIHRAPVCAQTASAGQTEVRGLAGYANFIDEGDLSHFAVGGSAQIYLTRRFSVGPEFLYLYRDSSDHDITGTAHFAWDFKGGPRFQPYVAGHIGVLRTSTILPGIRFAVNSWASGVGLGVKVRLSDRLYLVPDFRMAQEPLVRATVGLSYVLRR